MVVTLEERLMDVYHRLYQRYGPQHWWPGDGAFEVIIGAILTQSASWTNVDKALDNLKAQGLLEPAALRAVPLDELASLIRPSVYFNAKALKIKAFVEYLGERYNDDLEALFQRDVHILRPELLSIYGIGEETADDILLYAAGKPVFVMDAYTRRILDRLEDHTRPGQIRLIPGPLHGQPYPRRDAVQRVPRSAGPPRGGHVSKERASLRRMLSAGHVPYGSAEDYRTGVTGAH